MRFDRRRSIRAAAQGARPLNDSLTGPGGAVLDSLRMLLVGARLEVVCFASATALLSKQPLVATDCIVSDVRMPTMTGLDLLRQLQSRGDPTPLILITGHGDIAMAVAALKIGAFDFIEKPFDTERLLTSIKAAVECGAKAQTDQAAAADVSARIEQLTERQRQVMDLVIQGLGNKEIAIALGISPRTVENYRAWVMEKMDAKNLAVLVRKVLLVGKRDS